MAQGGRHAEWPLRIRVCLVLSHTGHCRLCRLLTVLNCRIVLDCAMRIPCDPQRSLYAVHKIPGSFKVWLRGLDRQQVIRNEMLEFAGSKGAAGKLADRGHARWSPRPRHATLPCQGRPPGRRAHLGPLFWLGPQRSTITSYSCLPSMMMGKKWIWPSGLVWVSCSGHGGRAGRQAG